MELLFDLLPLLVIYALARAFSRKRGQEAARAEAPDEAPAVSPNLEALLTALGAEPPPSTAERVATAAEEAPAIRRAAPRRREPGAVLPRPSHEPRPPVPDARRTPPARVAEGGYFETPDFEERGMRRPPPVVAAPVPPRPAAGLAERLRDPATVREAFVLQTLLSRRHAR